MLTPIQYLDHAEYACRTAVVICTACFICFWIEYLGMDDGVEG